MRRLLVTEPNAEQAIAAIRNDPELRRQALAALPQIERAARAPAGAEGVKEAMGRRFALYPQPRRSPQEWAAWWLDYIEVLADVPRCALDAAMSAWVRDPESQFLPKPGQLRKLAMEAAVAEIRAYDRARRAAA